MFPTAPGRVPFLGNLPVLLRDPIGMLVDARNYGDIVELYVGPRRYYVLNSPEFIHQALVSDAESVTRGRIFEKARFFTGQGLATSDGELHRRQRRVMQPAFHTSRMAGYLPIIQREAAAVASSWITGQQVALDKELGDLTLAIMTKAIFSDDYCQDVVAEVHRLLPDLVLQGFMRTLLPNSCERLPVLGNRRLTATRMRLKSLVQQAIGHYRSSTNSPSDLLATLMDTPHDDTGLPMSDDLLCDEVISLLFTGSETVATTLGWLFHELGRNPDIESRVHAELDAILGDGPIAYSDLSKLQYLDSVLNEVLRLYSPAWFLMRRLTAPITFGDSSLPAGTEVVYSSTALHRDPAIYPDPLRFNPDRRQLGTPRSQRATFIPFGIGRHQCLGHQFARVEVMTVVAVVASRWRLVPEPGHRVRARALTTLRPNKLRFIPRPRASSRCAPRR